ncbi:hypothetical protein MXB_2964, partial [Myxobolus squamalis]
MFHESSNCEKETKIIESELETSLDSGRTDIYHRNNTIYNLCQLHGMNWELTCTYERGYLPCQMIYICLTCQKSESNMAGICYGCSINCHKDHMIIK